MKNKNEERKRILDVIKNYYSKDSNALEQSIYNYCDFLKSSGEKEDYENILAYSGVNKRKVSVSSKEASVEIIDNLDILEVSNGKFKLENYEDPLPEATPRIKDIFKKNQISKDKSVKIFVTGKPGTGKTTYINFISYKTGIPIYYLKASRIISSFLGDTHKNIDLLKKDIDKIGSNGIVLIDEIDSLLGNRNSTNNDEYRKMIGSFNLMLDSLVLGTIIVGITNNTDFIDPAILRRFNVKIELDEVDKNKFISVFKKACLDNDILLDSLIIDKIINGILMKENSSKNNINFSVIDKIIQEHLFLGKNVYKNFINIIYNNSNNKELELAELQSFGLNKTEISIIMCKDRRWVSKNIETKEG